jgi:hypothetical protein
LLSGIGHILRFVRFSFVAFVFSRVRLYIYHIRLHYAHSFSTDPYVRAPRGSRVLC